MLYLSDKSSTAASASILAGFFIMVCALVVFAGCSGSKRMVAANEPPEPTVTRDPEPVVKPPVEETRTVTPAESTVPFVLQNVYFELDRYELTSEALQTLADNARVLKTYPEARIVIEGHCDERGTVEYNLALGDKRAKAVKDYLVSLGVNSLQISTISYGKERPLDARHAEEAWAKNRRAEFARR